MLKDLAVHLSAPKESSDTLRALAGLAGGFLGANLSHGLESSTIISILRGRETAPQTVLKIAKIIASHKDDKAILGPMINSGLGMLNSHGISKDSILSMAKSYSPILDVSLPSADVDSLTSAIITISERIVDADDSVAVNAIVTCPKCTFTFIV